MPHARHRLALAVVVCGISALLAAMGVSAFSGDWPTPSTTPSVVAPQVLVAAPTQLPPATLTVPLYFTSDALHYYVRLSVGTPAQTVNLILDTGSGDLILLSNATCAAYVPDPTGTGSPGRTSATACFAREASSTYAQSSAMSAINLQVDGENIRSGVGPVATDVVRLSAGDVGTLTTTTLSRAGTQLVYAPQPAFGDGGSKPLQYWPDTDGVLGASYSIYSFAYVQSFVALWRDTIDNTMQPVFSLDVNAADAASMLLLNGINETYRNALVWGDVMNPVDVAVPPGYHSFQLHAMQLCGADLFQSLGSQWSVIVDTGASCLNAPAEFFDMIVSWIPVDCQDESLPAPIGTGQRVCYLSTQFVPQLPTLNFKITADGDWLRLPLEDLLLPPSGSGTASKRRLCMTRGVSVYSQSYVPVWSFGTRTLRSLYAAFSMSTLQVGFANKIGRYAAPSNGSTLQCTTRRSCVGMQTHEPALNVCVDPPCNLYYFFAFDSDTKTCYLDPGFFTAVVVVVVIFLFTELCLHESTAYLSNAVYTQFAPPQRNAPAAAR